MGYIDVSAEVVTFLLSLALGAVLCFLYDIVRVMHSISVKGFFEVLVTDILFWIFAAFLTFCFLILRCQGMVRGYVLVGAAVGFFIIRISVSKVYMLLITSILRILSKVYKAVFIGFHRISAPVIKKLKKIQIVFKKLLQDKVKLLYNQLKIAARKNKGEMKSGSTD